MKYNYSGEIIPKDARKNINQKIEYIINNDLSEQETGISKEDIFNAYTGEGGLHGLDYKAFGNYYDYQIAKSEIEQGQFFTPYKLVEWIYQCLDVSSEDLVADLTCGHGAFISCCPAEQNFYGCELDTRCYNVAHYLYPEAHLTNADIRFYEPKTKFDYVVGNPPYNLRWDFCGERYLSEFFYCLKASELLKPGGIMAIIVPMSFCGDDFSNGGMIGEMEKRFNYICQVELDKNTFAHLGVENYRTKIMFMQRKSEFLADVPFSTSVLSNVTSFDIMHTYMKPIIEKRKEIKQKLLLEAIKNDKEDYWWQSKVTKLLYDIKRNPKTVSEYARCADYVTQYRTQTKPEHIKWDEWEKLKIKSDDVINTLKEALRMQNPRKSQDGRWVKRNYVISHDGMTIPINDYIVGERDASDFGEKWFTKFISRKQKAYFNQSQRFEDMQMDTEIAHYLDNFELNADDEIIHLNDMQKHDINLFLQKPYHFIQWEQGSGKTLAGIAIGNYRMKYNNANNVFVVSTAIAIKNNWKDVLEQYNIPFRMIESIKDIDSIERGEFVIITLNMLCKYYRQIKRKIRTLNQNVALVFDESDNMSNMDSKRTKAVLATFRTVKYKTLMTGTSTRNNIAEIYPQLELLYNNSYNMISECEFIKDRNKEGELEEQTNEYFKCAYPSYKKGFKLFTASHIPEKITVFGVSQFTQDILNADILKGIIDKTIITRNFEDITGKDLYEIKQITCPMGEAEKEVYDIAINEFYKMEYLFSKTGNSRKDAMLKVLNQLLALLKICAAPQTLREYDNSVMPEKFKTVISLLEEWQNERVAIGVRHISVVKAYEKAINAAFPHRRAFVITGNEATLKQRKKIIAELKKCDNGILISTQQSLSASMNIDFVDKCIVPELHWNNSSMSQYYFRFIRYTSTRFKTVAFVTYENSIESNLLKMVLVKDKLNLFMKSQELSDEELYDKFGVDAGMLQNLMYKQKTEDGYVLRWGNQEIKSA